MSTASQHAADKATGFKSAERIKVNGKPVRMRLLQMLAWGVILALCGAALVAGLYFNILEVSWHIHIGRWNVQLFYLKHWWDGGMGFIHSASWVLYRHGIRDILEPALATMAVKTILAKSKWWNVRVSPVRIALTVPALTALALAMAAGGIWLADFGLPAAWHAFFGTRVVTVPAWLANLSPEVILPGLVIGLILHRLWAPCGATLQGDFMDRAVERARRSGTDHVPPWVRFPVAPVQLRERFSWIMAHETYIRQRSRIPRWLIVTVAVVTIYLIVTGFIAHYWIGAGHSFPYLAP